MKFTILLALLAAALGGCSNRCTDGRCVTFIKSGTAECSAWQALDDDEYDYDSRDGPQYAYPSCANDVHVEGDLCVASDPNGGKQSKSEQSVGNSCWMSLPEDTRDLCMMTQEAQKNNENDLEMALMEFQSYSWEEDHRMLKTAVALLVVNLVMFIALLLFLTWLYWKRVFSKNQSCSPQPCEQTRLIYKKPVKFRQYYRPSKLCIPPKPLPESKNGTPSHFTSTESKKGTPSHFTSMESKKGTPSHYNSMESKKGTLNSHFTSMESPCATKAKAQTTPKTDAKSATTPKTDAKAETTPAIDAQVAGSPTEAKVRPSWSASETRSWVPLSHASAAENNAKGAENSFDKVYGPRPSAKANAAHSRNDSESSKRSWAEVSFLNGVDPTAPKTLKNPPAPCSQRSASASVLSIRYGPIISGSWEFKKGSGPHSTKVF